MKKQKKFLIQILIFFTIVLSCSEIFANENSYNMTMVETTEEYKEYIELSDEEKKNILEPRQYDISKTQSIVKNPLRLARRLATTVKESYTLKDTIPENMTIKNQQETNTCWTFAELGMLESHLALMDYKNNKSPIVYDYSERHMEYATSKTFKDGINTIGFNREIGTGGTYSMAKAYLTNGTGAIAETEMEFENNSDKIYLSSIQNKNVITQLNDTIEFPSYSPTEDTTQIKQQMKEHIKNYGGIYAAIYGAQTFDTTCYNNKTGAIYCDDSTTYKKNHAVLIVGWNDGYKVENFADGKKPQNNGAWIIKNSWGTESRFTLTEMKEYIFKNFSTTCSNNGWTSATQIPDTYAKELFTSSGYTIQDDVALKNIGDNGFMYVSYEDVNIYTELRGITNALSEVTYENIYQYDFYGKNIEIQNNAETTYLATVFDKKTSKTEYLTQVSIDAPETYTCKVYVNPNGTSKLTTDLQQIQLKTGETETFGAGYHTIEFQEPLKINSDSFVVVLEIQGQESDNVKIAGEYKPSTSGKYDNVTVESGKCFLSNNRAIQEERWLDTSTTYETLNGTVPNFDTTIKAFTTSKVFEGIEITKEPTKKIYIEGQDFDTTGMIVNAKYTDGTLEKITDYTITNGTKLTLGQTSVTIEYNGKTATQDIQVEKNTIETISIKNKPTKTEYWAGDNFETDGMVIEGTYKDGTKKDITDYVVKDGNSLKNGQTTVTIEYEGKTVTQSITVQKNTVEEISIKNAPNKVKYIVGQNFNSTGMIVEAKYKNGTVKQVENYTIKNGTDLKLEQTSVTIEYEEKTVEQPITVADKTVTEIKIKTIPAKTEYIQNKEELDLTGGVIEIYYDDESKEEMNMTSEEIVTSGFSNKQIGKCTIVITYKNKTAQFDIEVKEEKKPQNSNFDNIKGSIKQMKSYYFTDTTKKEYSIIKVDIENIQLAMGNDSMEYYYYLSTNPNETNIVNWIKAEDMDKNDSKLTFELNTLDNSNYDEISSADNLYLYVKEVAVLNDIKQEKLTSALKLEAENIIIEKYVDNAKKEDVKSETIVNSTVDSVNGNSADKTLAPQIIPKAGKSIFIIIIMLILIVVGRIAYLRYKDIQVK